MSGQTVLTAAPATAGNFAHLPKRLAANSRVDLNVRADGRAVGYGAHAFDVDPIIFVAAVVIEPADFEGKKTAVGDGQVQKAIIVVVAPRAANRRSGVTYDV